MSRNASQANCVDPLDGLVDFSEYEVYQSPSISPSSSKSQFVRPVQSTAASLIPPPQVMSGPSHQYDLHKQQTGIPVGGLANTLAINSSHMYGVYGISSGLSPADGFIDFGSTPSQSSYGGLDMDMEFDSPSTSPAFFFPEQTLPSSSEYVNPSVIGGQENSMPSAMPTQPVGRVWPGMHQQAAIAKAQQKQQQQLIQQQRQNSIVQQHRQQRPKAAPATDPIVEEKISQLLHSMRQGSIATSDGDDAATPNGNSLGSGRMRKDEEDMDEDERLLASEEGKKLSSKERRQLRNKVSARAFRSRRKEYIGQLEGEIAQKVNENSDLRAQNRALMEENTRLSDLTRMLLSSPSFSGFLDNLSTNPNHAPQQQQTQQQPVAQVKVEQSARPLPKDVNPYTAQQQLQSQQHINFALMPEQTMDFSLLDLNADYIFQPQVYSVLSLPEVSIDTSLLAGKTSNFVGRQFESEDEKVEMAVIDRKPVSVEAEIAPETVPVDEEFEADPAFALFADTPSPTPIDEDEASKIFAGIVSDKATTHFELVDVQDDEASTELALSRVQRLCSSMDAIAARLEAMTMDS